MTKLVKFQLSGLHSTIIIRFNFDVIRNLLLILHCKTCNGPMIFFFLKNYYEWWRQCHLFERRKCQVTRWSFRWSRWYLNRSLRGPKRRVSMETRVRRCSDPRRWRVYDSILHRTAYSTTTVFCPPAVEERTYKSASSEFLLACLSFLVRHFIHHSSGRRGAVVPALGQRKPVGSAREKRGPTAVSSKPAAG